MAPAEALQRSLASTDVSDPLLYQNDSWRPLFAQLRREDPVHYCEASPFGPYWSVTRYDDIFAVELDHGTWCGLRWTLRRQAGFSPDENVAAYGEVVWSWRRDPGVHPRRPVVAWQR